MIRVLLLSAVLGMTNGARAGEPQVVGPSKAYSAREVEPPKDATEFIGTGMSEEGDVVGNAKRGSQTIPVVAKGGRDARPIFTSRRSGTVSAIGNGLVCGAMAGKKDPKDSADQGPERAGFFIWSLVTGETHEVKTLVKDGKFSYLSIPQGITTDGTPVGSVSVINESTRSAVTQPALFFTTGDNRGYASPTNKNYGGHAVDGNSMILVGAAFEQGKPDSRWPLVVRSSIWILPIGEKSGQMVAVNKNGFCIGFEKGEKGMRPFSWNPQGGSQGAVEYLGSPETSGRPSAISGRGLIVGNIAEKASAWDPESKQWLDLNKCVTGLPSDTILTSAVAVTSKGHILCTSGKKTWVLEPVAAKPGKEVTHK